MNRLLPEEIASITGAEKKIVLPDQGITHIIIDSRKIRNPEAALFVAISGTNHNGHDYIPELVGLGVRNFLVTESFDGDKEEVNYYGVQDCILALQKLGANIRDGFHHPVVAITGSNGKTMVKEWLNHLLQGKRSVCRSPRSFNSQIGVPLSLWLLSDDHDMAIIEAGISQSGEMKKLQAIIKPDIGILTNIGTAHAENFLSDQQKFEEKCSLFRDSEVVIMQADEADRFQYAARDGQKLLTWGYEKGDLSISSHHFCDGFTEINITYRSAKEKFRIPFTDGASVANATICYLAMRALGFAHDSIAGHMQDLPRIAMRLESKEGINNCLVINDAYSSDINALAVALDFLNQQGKAMSKTVILSDIQQSGRPAASLYREINELLIEKNIKRAILIGTEVFEHSDVFALSDVLFYETPQEFYRDFEKLKFREEVILIKGARKYGFERISRMLSKKTHETVLEVNLDAVAHNLNYFRSIMPSGTHLMIMVKAFSYGSGSKEIARLMAFNRVDYLSVAYVDEGIFLRDNGITIPIAVMSPQTRSYGLMIANDLEPVLYHIGGLKTFSAALQGSMHADKFPYPVHIKLDTGMHRSGFMENQLDVLIDWFRQHTNVFVKSAFSHLAAADEPEHDDFTRGQIRRFAEMTDRLERALPYRFERHILNSAGMQRFPEAAYDMVRLGIGLYGIGATKECAGKLLPASRLITRIIQVKEVSVGESIGYGRAHRVTRRSRVGIIPIGYADGFSRRLGMGRGSVWINDQNAPVLGNVCMDMTMVDLTDIRAKEGDAVVVFDEHHPVTELADKMGTIPYEVLTGIGQRVKRVFYQES